jgi:asparagine synthase (glutamine-hydrolysing)
MSHFAGLYSLDPGAAPPARLSEALAGQMRSWAGPVSSHQHPAFVLHEAGSSLSSQHGRVTAHAGRLVPDHGAPAGAAALDQIRRANGTFALAEFDPGTGALLLVTDSLGARPLYWTRQGDTLIFSTSIRLIAALPGLRYEVDWTSVAEQGAFCYPLASRTPLIGVQVLRDGEALIASPAGLDLTRYHRWEDTPLVEASATEHADHFHAVFLQAVKDRCPPSGPVSTLLSGGLDSRCIAAALLDLGREVEAWNLSRDGWQDHLLAAQFAGRAGIPLQRVLWTRQFLAETPGFTTMSALLAASSRITAPQAFSGDGGGETIGFLMMKPAILNLLRQGHTAEAIESYVNLTPVSPRVVGRRLFETVRNAPREGMNAEFTALSGLPPQKAMQLFLLRNDMRRHLHDYFEYSELHSTELLLPYYDRRVLEGVIRIAPPLDAFLAHRLYYEWMKRFQAPVRDVPWQAYDGHEPCPLPIPPDAVPQWEALKPHRVLRGKDWRELALSLARREDPPHPALQHAWLRLAPAALISLLHSGEADHHFRDYLWISGLCRLARGEALRRL